MKKFFGVLAIAIVPTVFFGVPLGLLSGDWLLSLLLWPGLMVLGVAFVYTPIGVWNFLDWAFDD